MILTQGGAVEVKKQKRSILYKAVILICLLFMVIANSHELAAREKKDLVLVLDTSLSMVGYGGKNILPSVKRSLDKFIDQLGKGDSITFVTFDTVVKMYPTVYINDENDKDILKKYISVVQASGQWTYTQEMIKGVFKKATELEEKGKNRERVIVVLTDGLDDPPPEVRMKRLNIKEISTGYNNKDWFIYLINLSSLKNNPGMAKIQKDLSENVSKYTKIVNAVDEPSKVIEKNLLQDVKKDILQKEESEKTFLSSPYFLGAVIVLVLVLMWYVLRRYLNLRVSGRLDYWDHTIMEPYIRTVDLLKQNHREIIIGRGSGMTINIHDIEIPEPFRIVARRDGGRVKCALQWGNRYGIDFVNKEPGKFIEDGDVFKVANYTFRYNSD